MATPSVVNRCFATVIGQPIQHEYNIMMIIYVSYHASLLLISLLEIVAMETIIHNITMVTMHTCSS